MFPSPLWPAPCLQVWDVAASGHLEETLAVEDQALHLPHEGLDPDVCRAPGAGVLEWDHRGRIHAAHQPVQGRVWHLTEVDVLVAKHIAVGAQVLCGGSNVLLPRIQIHKFFNNYHILSQYRASSNSTDYKNALKLSAVLLYCEILSSRSGVIKSSPAVAVVVSVY